MVLLFVVELFKFADRERERIRSLALPSVVASFAACAVTSSTALFL